MKKITFLILWTLLTKIAFSQSNLVPNPGFEEVVHPDSCLTYYISFQDLPDYPHQVKYWFTPRPGSFPHYYNSCDTLGCCGVPRNGTGYQADGNGGHAYVGLITTVGADSDWHAVIMVRLTEALKKDHHYLFKMKASPDDLLQFRSNIGMCLEKDSAMTDMSFEFAPTYPEYTYHTDSILMDCSYWHEVIFHIVPRIDSLQFLLIGTFPTVQPVKARKVMPSDPCYIAGHDSTFSYMLVDDIQLYLDTSFKAIDEVALLPQDILISPNPAQNKIQVHTDKFESSYSWSLYDISGRLIQQYLISKKEQEIELPVELNSGMYLWKGERDGVLLNCGKLLVE